MGYIKKSNEDKEQNKLFLFLVRKNGIIIWMHTI
ncbi:hypothetical protein CLV62_10675 [Dysgonomonas alginatilytica]|uniref:Uncharacterized protein n=1 Tax=Dysgonomonas alginatilytica TaxID=1605892 RepID=A0A2V3PQE9_9BACT|nr:hypothetical protein CLV62_10675 [Dysgonomonas alginatilytica]